MKTDKKVSYFLFSLAFWSRCVIKNHVFFTRRTFTTMYHYASRKHRIHSFFPFSLLVLCFFSVFYSLQTVAHSLAPHSLAPHSLAPHSCAPHSLAPICFASFLVFFGLFWSYFVTLCSFFALSWPCNSLFSSLGGFIPGLELPPIFSFFLSFS
jgi:hypothetical protein